MDAALDVLKQESSDPFKPILSMDNVQNAPHVSGVSLDTWERRSEFICFRLQRVGKGCSPVSEINPPK